MSEPEISRRCLSCGATVRHGAAFCPQCGQMLDKRETPIDEERLDEEPLDEEPLDEADIDEAAHETPIDDEPIDEPTADESAPTVLELRSPDTVIIRTDDEELDQQPTPQSFETRPLTATQVSQMLETQPLHALPNATVSELPEAVRPKPGDNARQRHEASVLDRVEKLRKASSVMIDQAAYDPSFRFLLITALLFLLFVVLMILSKVVG